MGRYSPTVTPQYAPGLAEALAHAIEQGVETHQRNEDRTLARRSREIEQAGQGYRRGTAPTTETTRELSPDALGGPLPDNLRTLPTTLSPSGQQLANAFELPTTLNRGKLTPFASDLPQPGPAPENLQPQKPRPGAFDPDSKSFSSITRTVQRPVEEGRYIPLQSGGYIDTHETPRADAREAREAQIRLAAEFRNQDIASRGEQARTTEQLKQEGRERLRNSINGNALANTALRAFLNGQNQEAHDTRAAAAGAAHDQRVTSRVTMPGGTAEVARDRAALTLANGVLEASNGSYDGAVDWLENTPEGQAAAAKGLTKAHLYSALGNYTRHQQDLANAQQAGLAGKKPGEAASDVNTTRQNVTPPRAQPPGTPTGMAGMRGGGRGTKELSANDKGGDINLDDAEYQSRATWVQKNPPKAGETRQQYEARYQASKGAKK